MKRDIMLKTGVSDHTTNTFDYILAVPIKCQMKSVSCRKLQDVNRRVRPKPFKFSIDEITCFDFFSKKNNKYLIYLGQTINFPMMSQEIPYS